jgi:hypothetical protein
MMLNVNWPQLRKTYADLKESHELKDEDQILFQCVSRDIKSGQKTALKRQVQYKEFLQVFWDLCETHLQILSITITTSNGNQIYQHRSRHPEQMPIGGTPFIIANWNKWDDDQKELWLKIAMAQIEANA